jgi:hypothetical protein
MKTITVLLISIFFLVLGLNAEAQSCHGGGDHSNHSGGDGHYSHKDKSVETTPTTGIQLAQIAVSGNCDLCKTRIENAAKVAGATSAGWNPKTQFLSVVYDAEKTSLYAISKQIAFAGHDNEKCKTDNKTYNNLPKCCKYERKISPTDKQAVIYTCPMHPGVQSDKPGECPKCGMKLVK